MSPPKIPKLPPDWIVVNHGTIQGGDKKCSDSGDWIPVDARDVNMPPQGFICIIRKAS